MGKYTNILLSVFVCIAFCFIVSILSFGYANPFLLLFIVLLGIFFAFIELLKAIAEDIKNFIKKRKK